MKFTQRSFPVYVLGQMGSWLGLRTAFSNGEVLFLGWGWYSMYLNYFVSIHPMGSNADLLGKYLSVTSELTVESRIDRAENA